jgi:hypothetical protein
MKRLPAALLLLAGLAGSVGLFAQSPTPPQAIDVRLIGESKNTWKEPTTIFGLLGVVGGIGGVLLQRYWHRIDERKRFELVERDVLRRHVLDSLKWFEGKTQKRSIGIAVIEGNWETFEDLRPTWLAILTNQAVYLLAKPVKGNTAHERVNLERIMNLLLQESAALRSDQKEYIRDAIYQNRDGKGLREIEKELLEEWDAKLK